MVTGLGVQALGPVALVSLLLNTGLIKAVPGSDINENPNLPEDPELQERFNRAAVQVTSCCRCPIRKPAHNYYGSVLRHAL